MQSMNYTINYPTSSGGQLSTQLSSSVMQAGQRTIVLTPPSQPCQSNSHLGNNTSPQFPVIMQAGAQNPTVYYMYPNGDNVINKSNESGPVAHNGIGQIMLLPVSPIQNCINMQGNNTSPTVNIQADNKNNASQSLSEMFNLQGVAGMQQQSGIVQSKSVQSNVVAQHPLQHSSEQQSNEFASLISTLQAGGLQIVKNGNGNNVNCAKPVSIPVMSSNIMSTDINVENSAMNNFITSLQASGAQIVENNTEKTLTISLPNASMEDQQYITENRVPVPTNAVPVPVEQMYQNANGCDNVSMLTSGSDPSEKAGLNISNIPAVQSGILDVER